MLSLRLKKQQMVMKMAFISGFFQCVVPVKYSDFLSTGGLAIKRTQFR